jgi:hypothetical protein
MVVAPTIANAGGVVAETTTATAAAFFDEPQKFAGELFKILSLVAPSH